MQNWKTQKYTTTQEACGSAASLTLDITRRDFFSHGKSGTVVVVVSFISNRIQQWNNTRKKKTLCRYPLTHWNIAASVSGHQRSHGAHQAGNHVPQLIIKIHISLLICVIIIRSGMTYDWSRRTTTILGLLALKWSFPIITKQMELLIQLQAKYWFHVGRRMNTNI